MNQPEPLRQTPEQLRAEVRFRSFHSKLYDEVQQYMQMVLKHRVDELRRLMARGFELSPFLEIGAETGANSLALVNGCAANGFALDVSLQALVSMEGYARRMGLQRLPERICADARNLPLVNRSMRFELCWGTLHHFDDPGPASRELRRVIRPDGALLFDGEPVRRLLSLHLWRTCDPQQMGRRDRLLLGMGLLPWLADIAGIEPLCAGALENKFPIDVYKRGLSAFERIEYGYRPLVAGDRPSHGPLASALFRLLPPLLADRLPTYLFGGTMHGIARPSDESPAVPIMTNGMPGVSGGGDLIVLKRVGQDRLRLAFEHPLDPNNGLGLSVEGAEVRPRISGRLVELDLPRTAVRAAQMRMRIDLSNGARLKALALDGGQDQPLVIPAAPPPEAGGPLACPACLVIGEGCAPELCGRPCLAACARGALSVEHGRAKVDFDRCTRCMDCARACPFGAVDRQPLSADLECSNCGERYPVVDGVKVLLEPHVRQALYPQIGE
ncbi:MAG: methyltransferase domain-containing protein [Candidatus Alcyoniella australis]|nr:methyltransferase domain-containing protein [Candidatus Alcyoniella australis]